MEEEKLHKHPLAEEDLIHLLLVDNRIQFLILFPLVEIVTLSTELIIMDPIFLTVPLALLTSVAHNADPLLVAVLGHLHMEFVT
jgi:hypothetical protein